MTRPPRPGPSALLQSVLRVAAFLTVVVLVLAGVGLTGAVNAAPVGTKDNPTPPAKTTASPDTPGSPDVRPPEVPRTPDVKSPDQKTVTVTKSSSSKTSSKSETKSVSSTGPAEKKAAPKPPPLDQGTFEDTGTRLVVIIAVDQLRADYLQRFARHFEPGGFRRFLDTGAVYTECRHRHATTSTGNGHAVISTGSFASRHGIIENEWWDPLLGRTVYCVEDRESPTLPPVPGPRDRAKPNEGKSPRLLLVNTIGDQLKMATHGRARVVSIALKDRSAILMGGHAADEVYWYDTNDGNFVTSFYYRSNLAPWVEHFNRLPFLERAGLENEFLPDDDKKPKDAKAEKKLAWRPLLPAAAYAHLPENNPKISVGDLGTGFPHVLPKEPALFKTVYGTPFGNELVLGMVGAAVDALKLGRGEAVDLLCVGFSSNDAVGHAFGLQSREVMDITVRTDRQLARLFTMLDERVGPGKWTAALTADHGVTPINDIAHKLGVATWRVVIDKLRTKCEQTLAARYGVAARPYIRNAGSGGIHFDWELLAERKIDRAEAARVVADLLCREEGVAIAMTRDQLLATPTSPESGESLAVLLARDYHVARGPDVVMELLPLGSAANTDPARGTVEKPVQRPTGANHGAPWDEDMRVPMLLMGPGIPAGRFRRRVGVDDLAPTIAELLRIPRPSAAQGRVLEEVLPK